MNDSGDMDVDGQGEIGALRQKAEDTKDVPARGDAVTIECQGFQVAEFVAAARAQAV